MSIRTRAMLCMFVLCAAFWWPAQANAPTLPIPVKATFLATSQDPRATLGTAFTLEALQIRPGERIRMRALGTVNFCEAASCAVQNPGVAAAFTAGERPAASTTLPTGLPDFESSPTLFNNIPTAIPGVFGVGGVGETEVVVPEQATVLWLAMHDSFYGDNSGSLVVILDKVVGPPVFPLSVNASITAETVTADANFFPRPQDTGTTASTFVFALAPAGVVKNAHLDSLGVQKMMASDAGKDTPVPCVLAQMNAAGQLQGVASASALQAAITGVLNSEGQSVSILNNVATPNVAGATFFVGYGSTAAAMIEQGINRSALTIPGSVICRPEPPQTGWWWNPLEDGRGFSVEVRGNNLFFAAFLYDISGRSTWYVASGPVSLDGTLFTNRLLAARGGQTLGGTYPGRPALTDAGAITLAFNTPSQGTLVWPGGAVPIERFNIVPGGIELPAAPNQPESGWWWNEQESGRGFFMEWQGGTLDIAGYMYDASGNPVWYLTVGNMTSPGGSSFSGSWWSYGNGQTLTGPWRPNAQLDTNVAPLTITFSAPDAALMTLPNGRTTALRRHRF